MFLSLLIGGACAIVGAALASGSDDSLESIEKVEEAARKNAEKARRKAEADARRHDEARRRELRRKEAREEFEGAVSAKFRAFRMSARIGSAFPSAMSECKFSNFNADFATANALVDAAISDRFKEERKSCAAIEHQIKELNDIIKVLKERGV